MNFIKFIFGLFIWGFLFWTFISIIFALASAPFISLFGFASEKKEKLWAKILLPISLFFCFIFGTLLLCSVYGGGVGLLALYCAGKASHPLVYFIIAGICAFSIIAPSGESNTIGMIISFLSYIVVINIHKIANLMGTTIGSIFGLIKMLLWITVPLIIVFWIIVNILNWSKVKPSCQTINHKTFVSNKTLTIFGIGTYILSVLSYAEDPKGNYIAPVVLIVLSAIATIVFTIMAAVRLWKIQKIASILLLLFSAVALVYISAPIKIINFGIFIWAIFLLWRKKGS